jgi:hypothetical protein
MAEQMRGRGRPKGGRKYGGRQKGRKNKATELRERYALLAGTKAGDKLGVEWLKETSRYAGQLMAATRPLDDEGKLRDQWDPELYFKATGMLTAAAEKLAQYESPKLSAIAIAPPQRETTQRVTIRIFDHKGNKLKEIGDDGPEPLQIEGKQNRR